VKRYQPSALGLQISQVGLGFSPDVRAESPDPLVRFSNFFAKRKEVIDKESTLFSRLRWKKEVLLRRTVELIIETG